jgi:hypothetical protein
MSFMEEAHAFVMREEVGSRLPAPCIQMLLDALDVFEEEPEIRDRGQAAIVRVVGEWRFSLLGMVAGSAGYDLVGLYQDRERNLLCEVREFLTKLGFTYYDQLCLDEVNGHSIKVDVLRERVLRFAQTGERMPFIDDLLGYNIAREE